MTYVIPVKSDTPGISYTRVAFYKSDKTFISCTYSGTSAVEIPQTAVLVRVSNMASVTQFVGFNTTGDAMVYESYVFGSLLSKRVPDTLATKSELASYFPVSPSNTTFFTSIASSNLQKQTPQEVGRLSNGVIDSTQTNYITYPLVDVRGNAGKYVVPEKTNGTISTNAYAFYTANMTFISGSNYSSNTAILIPNNAAYFRLSIDPATTTFFVGINETGEQMEYEEYFPPKTVMQKQYIDNNALRADWYIGKKVSALGDSITANATSYTTQDGRTGSAWREFVAEILSLDDTIYNCGVAGSRVSGTNAQNPAMWEDSRINAIPNDSDVVLFNGGVNDWLQNALLGDEDSTNTDTFYGALNTMAIKLTQRFPTQPIFWMTTTYAVDGDYDKNTANLTLYDYGRAIKKVAEKNGFIVIDLQMLCGWNRYNITNFVNNESGVYLHPNRNGGRKIATAICSVMTAYQCCEIE